MLNAYLVDAILCLESVIVAQRARACVPMLPLLLSLEAVSSN